VSGGTVGVYSDNSFGTGTITVSNSTIRFDQPGTYTRNISAGVGALRLGTNGNDATYTGVATVSSSFEKNGAGNLTITNPLSDTGGFTVRDGTLTLAENATTIVNNLILSVETGGTLVLDNRVVNLSNRITDGRNMSLRGDFVIYGNATAASSESLGFLSALTPDVNVTLVPGAGQSLILNGSFIGGPTAVTVRGDNLGGAAGSGLFTRLTLSTPVTSNGLMSLTHVSTSSSGVGDSFATYDTTTDAAGVIGVRALRNDEYVTTPGIRTGVNVASTAFFRVIGSVASEPNAGGTNQVHCLTFTGPGASMTIAPFQQFRIFNSEILVQASAVDASLSGGRIGLPNGNVLSIYTYGNLDFGTRLDYQISGQGVLNKNAGGMLRFTASDLFSEQLLFVNNGSVDFNGTTQTVRDFASSRGTTVNLNGGTLTTRTRGGLLEVAGSIVGTGTLNVLGDADGSSATFTGTSTFAGDVTAKFLQGNDFSNSSHRVILSGNGRWSNVANVEVGPRTFLRLENGVGFASTNRLGTAANVKLASGTLEYLGTAPDAINDSFGTLTIIGGNRLRLPQGGPSSALTFAGLKQVDNGTLRLGFNPNTHDVGGASSRVTTQLKFTGGLPTISDPNGPVGGQNTGVIPFLTVDGSGNGSLLATYDATGVRLMRPTDYKYFAQVAQSQDLAFYQHRNVSLTVTPAAIRGTIQVNSIFSEIGSGLNGAAPDSVLKIYSGVLAGGGGFSISSLAVDSGANTMYLYGMGTNVLAGSELRSTAGVVVAGNGGFGSSLTLNNVANSFTGGLYVNDATVNFTSDPQLGASGGAIVLNSGTMAYAAAAPANLSAARTIRIGEAHGAFNVSNSGGTLTIDSKISGPGDLYKLGPGTLVLANAANDYGGATVLKAGVTRLTADALPSGTKVILGTQNAVTAATLDLNGRSATIGGLQLAEANSGGTSNVVTNSAGTQSTLAVNGPGDSTFAGLFTGDIRFVKSGSGRFTTTAFNAFNSMTGPIEVNGGRLVVVGGIGSTGTIAVSNTGVLGGTGTFNRAATVTNGGTIAPGASTGSMTFSNGLDLASGGVYEWEIAALTQLGEGSNYDQIQVNGNLVLGGTSTLLIDVSPLATVGPNSSDPFWNDAHTWSIIGLLGGQNPGNTNFASILNSTFSRGVFSTSVVNGGIFLNFNPNPVPEPSAIVLVGLLGIAATCVRRFRKQSLPIKD
jgi:fibronectin-binding autotransporter adhesin